MSAFAFIVFASSASAQKNEKAGLWKDTEK